MPGIDIGNFTGWLPLWIVILPRINVEIGGLDVFFSDPCGDQGVDHRGVIVLRHLLNMPLEQVGEALDVPVGTVGSRLNRAMASLRAALEADARASVRTTGATEAVR